MYALFKKEISNFLSSLIGIMVIVVFLLITGLFLWVFQSDFNVLNYGYANLDSLFILAPWVFLFLVPAVTMRSFAEENRTGTIEMLATKPLSDWQIIWAKFLAGVALVLLALIPTFVYYYSVYQLGLPKGNLDIGGIWGSYIGLFLLSSSFVSIGIFCSSLTNNQILAFIISVFLCGFLFRKSRFVHPAVGYERALQFVESWRGRHARCVVFLECDSTVFECYEIGFGKPQMVRR